MVWGVIELTSAVLLVVGGEPALPPTEAERSFEQQWREAVQGTDALHPYLGYVLDPDGEPSPYWDVSEEGFTLRKGHPEVIPPDDALVVGIFGGSVAEIMASAGQRAVIREVRAALPDPDRPVVVRSYALGGYKQPQQLMALVWALAGGVRLDIAINLDGFNDLVLPLEENLPMGVDPFYPRLWPERVAPLPSAEDQRRLGEIARLRGWEDRLGRLCAGPWGLSPTCRLVRRRLLGSVRGSIVTLHEALTTSLQAGTRSFRTHGPPPEPGDEEEQVERLVAFWRRASQLMHDLCERNGVLYLHFLQPNQHLPGSKPLSKEERERFARPDDAVAPMVVRWYPRLRAAGEELRAAGVRFNDLTQIFADRPATLYIDGCCHLNRRGNRLLARAVGRVTAQELVSWIARPAAR
jgi:hypothetical protein